MSETHRCYSCQYNPSCVLRIAGATLLWWPVLLSSGIVRVNPRPGWRYRRCKQRSGPRNYITQRISLRIHHNCGLHCSHEFRLLDYVYLLHMYHDSPSHCSTIPVVCSLYRQKPHRQHLCIVERLLDFVMME